MHTDKSGRNPKTFMIKAELIWERTKSKNDLLSIIHQKIYH
jgi:hypothetical protein